MCSMALYFSKQNAMRTPVEFSAGSEYGSGIPPSLFFLIGGKREKKYLRRLTTFAQAFLVQIAEDTSNEPAIEHRNSAFARRLRRHHTVGLGLKILDVSQGKPLRRRI